MAPCVVGSVAPEGSLGGAPVEDPRASESEIVRLRVEKYWALNAAELTLEAQLDRAVRRTAQNPGLAEQEQLLVWRHYLDRRSEIEQAFAARGVAPAPATDSGAGALAATACDFCTKTPGGWGAPCNGGNVGCIRDQYFDVLFPSGLVVGDPDGVDGDGLHAMVFTSAAAVEAYLPGTGKASVLTSDLLDPASGGGVLGGHLVAAKFNVVAGAAGVISGTPCNPEWLMFIGCVETSLIGHSVGQTVRLAERALSGEFGVPENPGQVFIDVNGDAVADLSLSDLVTALKVFNEAFEPCASTDECLMLGGMPMPSGGSLGTLFAK